jgi:hypothetical protein
MVPTNVGKTFRSRLRARELAGCAIVAAGDDHYSIDCAEAHDEVNIYPMGDEPKIVEMRLERSSDGEPVFFLHFALEDEGRASALLDEMGEALRELREHQVTRILLCCTSGITTTFFANRLNEAAGALSLGYEFSALPFESAVRKGGIATYDYVGFQAVGICAKDCGSPSWTSVQGEDGYIYTDTPANLMTKVTLHLNDGTEEEFVDDCTTNWMYEWGLFLKDLESGSTERCYEALDTTLAVARTLTRAHLSAGVRFPADEQ